MSIAFHPAALRELEEVSAYYEERLPGLGSQFLDEMQALLGTLDDNPLIGRPGCHQTRSMPLPRFPFLVVYRVNGTRLVVLALAHYRRRPGYWGGR